MKVIEYVLGEGLNNYPLGPEWSDFDPNTLIQHGVDNHYLVMDDKNILARASLWWKDVPVLAGERLGVIGHFAASNHAAAMLLLMQLLKCLRELECTLAVGPMDGNTWRRYRYVTHAGSEPPFFLEPQNPKVYPDYFLKSGFAPMAQYTSARVTDLTIQDERIPRALRRLKAAGVRWRPLDTSRFEDELRAIYRLSLRCFAQNFLYTPIGEEAFLSQYRAVEAHVQSELTLMAEHEGELLGYLFGIPDLNQAQRGEKVDTFIVKTVAALPARQSAGLGSVLVAESHRIAYEQGYRQAIHALMHESNKSRNISAHYAHTMRRYTLYQQRLAPPTA